MCIQKVLRFLTFTYLCIYIHTYIHTPTSVYIYICVCVYVCMYVCTHIRTDTHLFIYVHIHLHIRIYMNICNICNNHEYTMHPTSPEASNPSNSETPTPDLHRTSYKLDIHTLSYIYTILCVYIYIYIYPGNLENLGQAGAARAGTGSGRRDPWCSTRTACP